MDNMKSKYKGVSWSNRDKKWAVSISVNGKTKHLGSYKDEEEAAKVYMRAALLLGRDTEKKKSTIEKENGITYVNLTKGKKAIIDDCFAEEVGKYSWYYSSSNVAVSILGKKKGKSQTLHRFILELKYGRYITKGITFKNENKLDCRIENIIFKKIKKKELPQYTSLDLKELETLNTPIRYINLDQENYYIFKDIIKTLNLKANVVPFKYKRFKKSITILCDKNYNNYTFLNKKGLISYLSANGNQNSLFILDKLGVDFVPVFKTEETEYIEIISNAFKHLKPVREYSLDHIRIDLYFPDHKLAIECNERNHCGYNPVIEKLRSDYIKTNNIKLIVFNPHEKNFNIGNTINEILINLPSPGIIN